MAEYVRKLRVTERFDGQDLVFMLTPLKYEDALMLKGAGKGEDVIKLYARMFPGYVQSCTPFYDANGEQVPVEEIAAGLFFVPLLGAVMGKHMTGGRVPDPSKPAAVPVDSSLESPAVSAAPSVG